MVKKSVIKSKQEISADMVDDNLKVETVVVEKKITKINFSRYVVGIIFLLFIGGFIALFFGPKLAPIMPAGMAPIAKFISQGEASLSEKLEKLNSDLSKRLSLLENAKYPDFNKELKELSIVLNSQIMILSDRISIIDDQDISASLSNIKLRVSELSTQIDNLSYASIDMLTQESKAGIRDHELVLIRLKSEIKTLSSKQDLLTQRINEMTFAKIVPNVKNIIIPDTDQITAIDEIKSALKLGSEFVDALAALSKKGVKVPTALNEARNGVATLSLLKANFPAAARAGLKASIKQDSSPGLTGKIIGFLKSQVTIRSLDSQEGASTDAVLSRIQVALNNDNLSGVLFQKNDLDEPTRLAMNSWLLAVKKRQAALDAVANLLIN